MAGEGGGLRAHKRYAIPLLQTILDAIHAAEESRSCYCLLEIDLAIDNGIASPGTEFFSKVQVEQPMVSQESFEVFLIELRRIGASRDTANVYDTIDPGESQQR